jgi:hypothetical protein
MKATVVAVAPTDPEIRTFSISPKTANVGDTLVVYYDVANASRILLQPIGLELPVNLNQFEFQADKAGTIEYRLVAYNAEGKAEDRTFRVQIRQVSAAKVIEFRALLNGVPVPKEGVDPFSRITLEWQVENAVRVEISPGLGSVSSTGSLEVFPEKTTTYTLTAKDANGMAVTAQIKIVVKEPTPGDGARGDVSGGSGGGSGGGAGGSGGG